MEKYPAWTPTKLLKGRRFAPKKPPEYALRKFVAQQFQ
jgi:hypothetical protein